MKKLQEHISMYFNLSRKESNGFLVLCLLMIVLVFLPTILRALRPNEAMVTKQDQHTLDSLVALLETKKANEAKPYTHAIKTEDTHLFSAFNPNTSSEKEMNQAGVPAFIAQRIIKYRSKGGFFKTKEDLKKIYGLSASSYRKLEPYILIPETKPAEKIAYTKITTPKTITSFDLNQVDSVRLIILKGIGPTFASRILKFRNKLGGFVSMNQLKEVYGLDSLALTELEHYGYIDKSFMPGKINLNKSNEEALATHPYIGKKLSKILVSYRQQHGPFISLDQLKNIKALNDISYQKLIPYLTIE